MTVALVVRTLGEGVKWPVATASTSSKLRLTEWPCLNLMSNRNSPLKTARICAGLGQAKYKSQISLPTLWVPKGRSYISSLSLGFPKNSSCRTWPLGSFPNPLKQAAGLPGPRLLGGAVGSCRKQALIVPLCLAAQWEPVSCQQLYVALTAVDTSLGEAHSPGDPVCFMSLQVGPVGWLSVPEDDPHLGGTGCLWKCTYVCSHQYV